jgi:hypothetical protein
MRSRSVSPNDSTRRQTDVPHSRRKPMERRVNRWACEEASGLAGTTLARIELTRRDIPFYDLKGLQMLQSKSCFTDAAKFPARWPGSRRPGRCEMHQLGLQDLQVLAISSLTCPDEVTLESRANHLARSLSAQVDWKPDQRGVSSAVACRVLRSSPIWCG